MATHSNHEKAFEVLTADVAQLQHLLETGTVSSEDIVTKYLDQIDKHNVEGMKLRALISVAPRDKVLQQARTLDAERKSHGSRGPMHGIPIIVKLLEAGMIIIGKASLSELALKKDSPPLVGGWSSMGGQGQSPNVRGGVLPNATFLRRSTPTGSSSGSAMAVISKYMLRDRWLDCRAGFTALFSLKPTVGTGALKGSMPGGCESFDVHGGMARTAKGLADITGIFRHLGSLKWSKASTGRPYGLPPDFDEFHDAHALQYREMDEAAARILTAGGRVVRDIPLMNIYEIGKEPGGDQPDNLLTHDFRAKFNEFLQGYEEAPVRSLKELIEYHKEHADVCLPPEHPGQKRLEALESASPDPEYFNKSGFVRRKAIAVVAGALRAHNVDVIVSLADARIASLAATAGIAVGTLPVGFVDFNG
ncbi:hypothetical protein IFR05_004445 [Cadophora sp. M221]|nr:hypothetical protein IFR05_004445 [Cadophora sp. M221]